MRIIWVFNVLVLVFMTLNLCSSGLLMFFEQRHQSFDKKVMTASESYSEYLKIYSNTYNLLRLYADHLLLGINTRRDEKDLLKERVRNGIATIKKIIAEGNQDLDKQEFVNAELLSRIEHKTEDLFAQLDALIAAKSANTAGAQVERWRLLHKVFEEEINNDFQNMGNSIITAEVTKLNNARKASSEDSEITLRITLAFIALTLILSSITLIFTYFQVSRPLSMLLSGARELEDGRFEQTIDLPGSNEISKIAQVLNEMAAKVRCRTLSLHSQNVELGEAVRQRTSELQRLLKEVQRSEIKRRLLLADVSHELRTPLTIIKGEAEVALRGTEKSKEEYRHALQCTRDAAEHTSRLVDDLLFIARQEAEVARLNRDPVDMVHLLKDTIKMTGSPATLEIDVDRLTIDADKTRLRQSIIALLQNARLHGGDKLVARLSQMENTCRIAVEDDGPGLSMRDKENAFDRFFRGSNAKQDHEAGSGLGLPVVRAIARAHGGEAFIIDRPGGGTIVMIELPIVADTGPVDI